MRIAAAAAVFLITWLLWSGHYTFLLLALGCLSCAIVMLVASRVGFFELEVYALHLGPRLPRYWLWLLGEILKANLTVAKIVLSKRPHFEPTVVTIDASHLPSVAQATLANAVTLTPGTVSLDVDRGMIEVHCLTREFADDLRGGEMVRRATELSEG